VGGNMIHEGGNLGIKFSITSAMEGRSLMKIV
jgi:hypothetical protein